MHSSLFFIFFLFHSPPFLLLPPLSSPRPLPFSFPSSSFFNSAFFLVSPPICSSLLLPPPPSSSLPSAQGVSVEAVDPVFQAKMLDMLKQTGRPEMVVGWYHSHPGFGCWLSGVDINTQQSFEALSSRAVAVVVDPIQSVKGEVCVCPR